MAKRTRVLGKDAPEHWWDEMATLRERIAELEAEKKRLRERLIEALEDAFFAIAHLVQDDTDRKGWYDSQARSTAVDVGNQLVELGVLERHPDGYGRRWFYRRKQD